MLVVRATMQDMDLIEAAIQVLNLVPPQVNIKAKFVEINQQDQKALGFDWYMGNLVMGQGSAYGMQAGSAPSFNGANPPATVFPAVPSQAPRYRPVLPTGN